MLYVLAAFAALVISDIAYQLIFWRTYEESWAWVHQRHCLTGALRHIQKVRGVPMAPPTRCGEVPPPRR